MKTVLFIYLLSRLCNKKLEIQHFFKEWTATIQTAVFVVYLLVVCFILFHFPDWNENKYIKELFTKNDRTKRKFLSPSWKCLHRTELFWRTSNCFGVTRCLGLNKPPKVSFGLWLVICLCWLPPHEPVHHFERTVKGKIEGKWSCESPLNVGHVTQYYLQWVPLCTDTLC